MNNYIKIALVTLFVTNFTLFLGRVPIGVLIPQVAFVFVFLAMRPDVFISKTMILYYLFFLYETTIRAFYGVSYDLITAVARFLVIAVPLLISTALFSPKAVKSSKGVSIFAMIVSFVTVLLSIRVLLNDGNALRLTSMANSIGDEAMLYGFWRQGMADYGMAAMMAFMPVVLIYRLKMKPPKSERRLLWLGIISILTFMFLGQVTTTFILTIAAVVLSLLNVNNKFFSVIGGVFVGLLVITQFSGLMDFFISNTEEGSMNGNFVSIAEVSRGEVLDEASDASIRWGLLLKSIHVFFSNPLFGNPSLSNGGHNYFLNMLANFGLIGCLPFFMLIGHQFKLISSYLSKSAQRSYSIIFLLFILLGLIKYMSGTEYWNYLFIYYPAILVWMDSQKNEQFVNNKNYI